MSWLVEHDLDIWAPSQISIYIGEIQELCYDRKKENSCSLWGLSDATWYNNLRVKVEQFGSRTMNGCILIAVLGWMIFRLKDVVSFYLICLSKSWVDSQDKRKNSKAFGGWKHFVRNHQIYSVSAHTLCNTPKNK